MDSDEVRRGITQFKANESASGVLGFDAMVLLCYVWFQTGHFVPALLSIVVFAVVALVVSLVKPLSIAAAILLGIGYGYLASAVLSAVGVDAGTALGVAIFVGLCAAGAHGMAFEYTNDLHARSARRGPAAAR